MVSGQYPPIAVNEGSWVASYTLNQLKALPNEQAQFTLPIVPIGASLEQVAGLGSLVLPPLYREAMDDRIRESILDRIFECFPIYGAREDNRRRVQVVEMEASPSPPSSTADVLAFSVDTAIEEHGPHLPLATDTIQSYSVLYEIQRQLGERFFVAPPLDYGQLTWGLPFGFSVDLTVDLLRSYVARFAKAACEFWRPSAVYVVDVHGSITHRQAIVDGLTAWNGIPWRFRWLHEPLAEFASARGDQHAGGVETALVERVSTRLLDSDWWPGRRDEIADRQMSFERAVDLTPDLTGFLEEVRVEQWNGVIGDIGNYDLLDADHMFQRMLDVANTDVEHLLRGSGQQTRDAGASLW